MEARYKFDSWETESAAEQCPEAFLPFTRRTIFSLALLIGMTLLLCSLPMLVASFPKTIQAQESVPTLVVPNETMKSILVARMPIKAGEKLVAVQFKRVRVPKNSPAAYAISDPDMLSAAYARRDLFPDVPLAADDVRFGAALNEVVANIPADHRALSISVDSTSAVEGWAGPGANVDVILIATQDGVETSNVLARNARVLSVDRRSSEKINPTESVPATITLLLRKEEAPRVGLGSRIGKVVLHLRGTKEKHPGGASQLLVRDLYRSSRSQNLPLNLLSVEAVSRPKP